LLERRRTKASGMVDEASGQRGGLLRKVYSWMMANAQGKHAWAALAMFSFAEASFFPIPPDVMLLPMMLADRRRAFHLAGWCALWSIIGGCFGYLIGSFFWDTAGIWIIHALHIPLAKVEALRADYAANAYLIAVQGLTPIPFKLVTISAGLAQVPFLAFVLFAALARTVRFVVIEGLLVHWFGAQAKAILDKYMEIALVVFLIAVVLGIVLVTMVL
jgi:membrane protein YqaA with SNARE-associated domain